MENFRRLRAGEIECRVAQTSKTGEWVSLLLYKDARVDMNILDETVGPMNWRRNHQEIGGRLYCTVSIYDAEKGAWTSKQDVGTESNAEKEKGHASDSFKRACFNWGIGRELYTAPKIFIKSNKCKIEKDREGKWRCKSVFYVSAIEYNNAGRITWLQIVADDHVAYEYGKQRSDGDRVASKEEKTAFMTRAEAAGYKAADIITETGMAGDRLMYSELERAEARLAELIKGKAKMNNVILTGRLTRDPSITTAGDLTIARFTVAIDRPGVKDENKQQADFPSCVAFGKTAELIDKYGYQGQRVGIEGRLQTGSYEKDGVKVYTTDVNVHRIEFLSWREEGQENSRREKEADEPLPAGFTSFDDDDMPF